MFHSATINNTVKNKKMCYHWTDATIQNDLPR